jgi:hypothetical protein
MHREARSQPAHQTPLRHSDHEKDQSAHHERNFSQHVSKRKGVKPERALQTRIAHHRSAFNKNRQAHQSNSGLQLGHFHPSGYLRGSQVHDGHRGDRDSETHPSTSTFVIATQVAPLDERIWNAGLNKNGDDKTNNQDRSHIPEVGRAQ